MGKLAIISLEQAAQWNDALAQSFQHDFYHLPQYHALVEEQGEGQAQLFLYTEGEYAIALPLLLRSIHTVPGLARFGRGWRDATSVYGYAGPVASHVEIPLSVVKNFQAALHKALQERNIVTVFSRLHPLVPQYELLFGLGDCQRLGLTVSIDLTAPAEIQRRQYRKSLRNEINRIKRHGVHCIHEQGMSRLNEFVEIYYETMGRVHASKDYYFDALYFEKLLKESNVHLFACLLEDKLISASLYTLCDGIVQSHLGGVRNAFISLSPSKLELDTVRLWANECGAHTLHLGGGFRAREDSFFYFKTAFSDQRHQFSIWRWVLLPNIYKELCSQKTFCNRRDGSSIDSTNYFPIYRCPTVTAQAELLSKSVE